MRQLREGEPLPIEVLGSRDLNFYRNQTDCHWEPQDDPFSSRDRLPFVHVGLAELEKDNTVADEHSVLLVRLMQLHRAPFGNLSGRMDNSGCFPFDQNCSETPSH